MVFSFFRFDLAIVGIPACRKIPWRLPVRFFDPACFISAGWTELLVEIGFVPFSSSRKAVLPEGSKMPWCGRAFMSRDITSLQSKRGVIGGITFPGFAEIRMIEIKPNSFLPRRFGSLPAQVLTHPGKYLRLKKLLF